MQFPAIPALGRETVTPINSGIVDVEQVTTVDTLIPDYVLLHLLHFALRRVRLNGRATPSRRERLMNEMDYAKMVGGFPACGSCGDLDVTQTAETVWDVEIGEWRIAKLTGTFRCNSCGVAKPPEWHLNDDLRRARIRALNDDLRQGRVTHGSILLTQGIQDLGDEWVAEICTRVSSFDVFDAANDPHGEHDFGSLEVAGDTIFWKIDYYDRKQEWHSPDAANPDLTHRVLTLILESEY